MTSFDLNIIQLLEEKISELSSTIETNNKLISEKETIIENIQKNIEELNNQTMSETIELNNLKQKKQSLDIMYQDVDGKYNEVKLLANSILTIVEQDI